MSFNETNPQTAQKKIGTGENDYQPVCKSALTLEKQKKAQYFWMYVIF